MSRDLEDRDRTFAFQQLNTNIQMQLGQAAGWYAHQVVVMASTRSSSKRNTSRQQLRCVVEVLLTSVNIDHPCLGLWKPDEPSDSPPVEKP